MPTDPAAYTAIADRIEAELRAMGAWDAPAPEGSAQSAFGEADRSFTQWLRHDLTPRLRAVAAQTEEPPPSSMVGARAVREFDGVPDADGLIDALGDLDRLVELGP